MIAVKVKDSLISQQEIWFYDGAEIQEADKNLFYQALTKPIGQSYREFHTLAINLKEAEDDIFSRISRTFKYHIRKAEILQLTYKILDLSDKSQFDIYLKTYNDFAKRKKLMELPTWRVSAFVRTDSIRVSVVEKDNVRISMHAYIHDGIRTRLLTSHSTGEPDAVSGYCNKFHHWQDIRYFKSKSFVWYDFGGVSADKDDGRNYFKQSFGGERQLFYHYITCKGLMKIWVELRAHYERFTKRALL